MGVWIIDMTDKSAVGVASTQFTVSACGSKPSIYNLLLENLPSPPFAKVGANKELDLPIKPDCRQAGRGITEGE
jgi:hypothetical protein